MITHNFILACVLALPGGAAAESLLEAQSRASEALTARVQTALDRRFGPGRAVVSASVRLRLSDRGSDWIGRLLAPPKRDGTPAFVWVAGNQKGGRFVLPGIPSEDDPAAGTPEAGTPPIGVAAEMLGRFETEVDEQRVRVTLDAALPAEAEAEALAAAEAAADADAGRGDRVTVERAPMSTPFERVLRDPAVWGELAGPAAAAGFGIAVLLGAILLALAASRSARRGAETLAAALVRAAGALEVRRGDGAPGEAVVADAGEAEGGDETRSNGEILFDLEVEHVPKLAHLLHAQPARNVALVMPHLKPEVQDAYLSAVTPDAVAEVLSAMATVRFVEPELLRSLKEELECRVRGVVGGPEETARIISTLGEAERKAVLLRLDEKNPEAAAAIRERVLLFENLGAFDAAALARIASSLGPEEAAAAGGGEGLREAFAAAFSGRGARAFWETVQLLSAAPDAPRERAARKKAVAEAEALIRAEKISRPARCGALPRPAAPKTAGIGNEGTSWT